MKHSEGISVVLLQPRSGSSARSFRQRLQSGFTKLNNISLLVCTPSPCDLGRIEHLWQTVRLITGLPCKHVEIIILIDARNPDAATIFQKALEPISGEFTLQIVPALSDLRMLAWAHKRIVSERFIGGQFDLFLYLEDDMSITAANLAYFLAFKEPLKHYARIPSFVRCEYDELSHQLVAVDHVAKQKLLPSDLCDLDDVTFVSTNFPYCAMYIMDQDMASDHQQSAAFSEEKSRALASWGVIERANMGLMFDDVPVGVVSRYVLPINRSTGLLLSPCIVHHMPDKYAGMGTEHSKAGLASIFSAKDGA